MKFLRAGGMRDDMEIVVVEDNEEDADRLVRFLRSNLSNTIRLFHDGADAARFLLLERDPTPKLFLLDLVLPSVDGIELYNMIKAEPKERNLSVIVMVNSAKTKAYVESIGLHPDGFLKKPTSQAAPERI